MSIKSILLSGLLCSLTGFGAIAQSNTGELTVEVSKFRNTEGHLLISLFNKSEGYPEEEGKAYSAKKVKVKQDTERVVFSDLPYGDYALIFLHDENDNLEMNTNLVGMPQEGYGASNNAVNTFSAPKYEEAKFQLSEAQVKQSLKIYY